MFRSLLALLDGVNERVIIRMAVVPMYYISFMCLWEFFGLCSENKHTISANLHRPRQLSLDYNYNQAFF